MSAHVDLETISEAERLLLEESGYEPVLRWRKRTGGCTVVCTTGEALKNIEIDRQRASCRQVPRGADGVCRVCGALLDPAGRPLGSGR